MIPTFIPSKDRPAQLLLLLESLYKNAYGLFKPYIMYMYSSEEFKLGYQKVIDYINDYKTNGVNVGIPIWINENECRSEKGTSAEEIFYNFLETSANSSNEQIICLFSDDSILYRPFKITEKGINHLFQFNDLFTFTLRLGTNITVQDYVHNTPIEKHPADLIWRWDEMPFRSAFGFATGFDGYFYKARDLLELSERKPFDRICFWEKMICEQFEDKRDNYQTSIVQQRPMMACPKESKVVVEQCNVTHSYPHNTTNKYNISLKQLNDLLLSGQKISLEDMDFNNPPVNCTHEEREFKFKTL